MVMRYFFRRYIEMYEYSIVREINIHAIHKFIKNLAENVGNVICGAHLYFLSVCVLLFCNCVGLTGSFIIAFVGFKHLFVVVTLPTF